MAPITRSWRSFLNFNFSIHFSKVDELLNEHRAKIVQSENISTPIYVQCDKMYRSKVCDQEFWYFVSGLGIQVEQPENDNSAPKKIGSRLQDLTTDIRFLGISIWTYGLVVQASPSESGDMASNAYSAETPDAPLPFCVVPSLSLHWYTRFHISALQKYRSLLTKSKRKKKESSSWQGFTPGFSMSP